MTETTSFQVGSLRCHLLDGGRQRLDGGAMFGVVPKPLWERKIPADERNRIPLAMRCLLIEHEAGPILVDTGAGNKDSEKFRNIYGIANAGTRGPTVLEDSLAAVGFAPGDVRYVINTHLHFDHAGGNTFVEWREDGTHGEPVLAFPEATYVVQKTELAFARGANERTAASYLPPNFEPVERAGRWRLVDGEADVVPGIRVVPTPGHVPGHQSVMVADGGDVACYLGDLVPTAAHLPLPWIMGYDLEPLVTLETKRALLGRAEADGWRLVFEHDPERGLGRVVREGKSYGFADA
jgi:glyoxylase-like metal-dependent hydrolase (beta-lactamase superfamily II)